MRPSRGIAMLAKQFRVFADACGDPVFLLEDSGAVVAASADAHVTWGYEEGALEGLPLATLLATPTLARSKDGTLFPVEIRSGLPVQGTYRQTVIHVLSEDDDPGAARDSETRFSRIFNASTNGMAFTEPTHGRILDVNDTWVRESGIPRAEAVGKTALELGLWANSPDREACLALLQQYGRVREFETVLTMRAGLHHFAINAEFVKEHGEQHVLWEFRDITERRRAEEALRFVTSRHDAILASVPDIIMEVDVDKTYTWANAAGYGFFGDDVVGREAADYFEGEQETYEVAQPLFEGSEDVVYVGSWQRRKDGEKRLLAWWCRVLKDAQGDVTGALSTARDITERQQAETERKELLSRLVVAQEEERKRIADDIHDDSIQVMWAMGIRLRTLRGKLQDPALGEELQKVEDLRAQAVARLRSLAFGLRPRVLDESGLAAALRAFLEGLEGGIGHRMEDRMTEEPPQDTRAAMFRIAQEALVNVWKHSNASRVDILLEERGRFRRADSRRRTGLRPGGLPPDRHGAVLHARASEDRRRLVEDRIRPRWRDDRGVLVAGGPVKPAYTSPDTCPQQGHQTASPVLPRRRAHSP